MLIQRGRRIGSGFVEYALEPVYLRPDLQSIGKALCSKASRQGDIAHTEIGAIRIIGYHERSVLGTKEIGPARARHVGNREIGRQSGWCAALKGSHRAQAGMEADEGPAADGNARGGSG